MQELVEFRIVEEFAPKLFADAEGEKLGDSVRKVELSTHDPKFNQVGKLQRETRAATNRSFFYGWHLTRKYSGEELRFANLFRLRITSTFEPPGEECGTEYDESTACPKCKAGATQVSDLRLDLRKTPKSKDIARTIAGEVIVSQRLAERMTDAGLTGFELRPVRHKARYEDDPLDYRQIPKGREILKKAEAAGAPHPTWKFWVWLNRVENRVLSDQVRAEYAAAANHEEKKRGGDPMPVWHQLVVTPPYAEIIPPTRVGIDPFDDDAKGECRCSLGDLIGLNLLSEVTLSAATRGNADIVCSKQFTGTRRGLLRPERVILVSPKVWKLLESEKVKGAEFEIAHLA